LRFLRLYRLDRGDSGVKIKSEVSSTASNRCLGRLLDGRVVDTSPMGGGNNALALDGGSWHPFLGTFGDLIEATRLSDK
jgi:hypothetical protein